MLDQWFNSEQIEHIRSLQATPAEELHWCGWYRNERHRYPELHPEHGCPRDFTCADKINMRCECCGNDPWVENGGRLVHRLGCTPEARRDFYASLELGEVGA